MDCCQISSQLSSQLSLENHVPDLKKINVRPKSNNCVVNMHVHVHVQDLRLKFPFLVVRILQHFSPSLSHTHFLDSN